MNVSRRVLLGAAAGGACAGGIGWAQPVEPDEDTVVLPPIPAYLGSSNAPEKPPSSDFQPFGSGMPPEVDLKVAARLLELAPFDCPPFRVAEYLNGVREGVIPDLGSDELNRRAGAHFACGWPDPYYNPIIIELFKATSLNPLAADQGGDGTHWCAAFVNWCIARGAAVTSEVRSYTPAELVKCTRSASSGSFRCWGAKTDAPQKGDIVVFAKRGTVTGNCPNLGTGHVGFFHSLAQDGRIWVLGGNQGNPTTVEGARNSAISVRRFRKNYVTNRQVANGVEVLTYQDFHSYRTASFLRG